MGHRSALDARGLEHRFLKVAKEVLPPGSRVIAAVSGGLDSVVLLHLLHHWRKRLKIEVAVGHVHHGPIRSRRQNAYRTKTAKFVARLADQLCLENLSQTEMPSRELKSEAELRDWRREVLERHLHGWGQELKTPARIASAHTGDDLLETRLIRMIRGTGLDGLKAISVDDGVWARLLLSEKKSTLKAYARMRRLKWCEDPSNENLDPLRNWIRHKWLPLLARRTPMGPDHLQRSLERIVEGLSRAEHGIDDVMKSEGLSRSSLLSLSRPDQRRAIALYFRQAGLRGYTSGHVEELLKRLDTGRRELKFKLVGRYWQITPQWIVVLGD